MAKKGKRRSSFDAKKKEPPKTNPFEKLGSKKRFDILGRKVRGDVRNVGQLRTDAADKVSVRRAICRGMHLTPQHGGACRHARDRPPRVCPRSVRRRCSWSTNSCESPTRSSIAASEVRLEGWGGPLSPFAACRCWGGRRLATRPPPAGAEASPACGNAEDDESLTAEEKAILRFQKQRLKDLGGARDQPVPPLRRAPLATVQSGSWHRTARGDRPGRAALERSAGMLTLDAAPGPQAASFRCQRRGAARTRS